MSIFGREIADPLNMSQKITKFKISIVKCPIFQELVTKKFADFRQYDCMCAQPIIKQSHVFQRINI